ncbi:MAG: 5-carboxymethyl-2-hydroxymuconate isomerase [Crocinitomicaceae bacterium]|nr:5-carboxymethyl-2-hydroxymuconate isomerase [Crocinitomicaceae bacterium]
MPHFVIDCSETLLDVHSPEEIMQKVHDAADSTQLFGKGDIKVRINPYKYYNVGNSKSDFIHVFANIMEGRNQTQKADLSRKIIKVLKCMFPSTPIISINIRDFEKVTYCNKSMV